MNIKPSEFSIPKPKLGSVTVRFADDYPSFQETTICQLIEYSRKQEYDCRYGNETTGGKEILQQMLLNGLLSMQNYVSILPALDDLSADVEIVLV